MVLGERRARGAAVRFGARRFATARSCGGTTTSTSTRCCRPRPPRGSSTSWSGTSSARHDGLRRAVARHQRRWPQQAAHGRTPRDRYRGEVYGTFRPISRAATSCSRRPRPPRRSRRRCTTRSWRSPESTRGWCCGPRRTSMQSWSTTRFSPAVKPRRVPRVFLFERGDQRRIARCRRGDVRARRG